MLRARLAMVEALRREAGWALAEQTTANLMVVPVVAIAA